MIHEKFHSPNKNIIQIIESWATTENPINSTEEILDWIKNRNEETKVYVEKIPFEEDSFWYYNKWEGAIINRNKTFFKIKGLVKRAERSVVEQPIIIQNEIGYLGIIAKVIDGILYFLMQAKIEPGNVNKIQISPTVQATKSNFMRTHGGKTPAYLEYFNRKNNYEVIVDQIQSEQSSRFYKKRNRNIIIVVDDNIEVLETHKWMTLGQIKELMQYDNLVNMDTRTVIACIPFSLRDYTYRELSQIQFFFRNKELFNSIFFGKENINNLYAYINEVKMLDRSEVSIVDLHTLNNWFWEDHVFTGNGEFKIAYFNIKIEGREIENWQQPLLVAEGYSIFGLIYCVDNGIIKFLVQAISEVGCFDKIEIGPSIQMGGKENRDKNKVSRLFFRNLEQRRGVKFSGLFSEEGGRFYHEENRNILMEIEKSSLGELPEGFFWADYQTLNILIQFNNCLNIQLRNLLSLLEL